MKFWVVADATATRWLDARGRWTRLYLCAQRFRRKRDAAQAASREARRRRDSRGRLRRVPRVKED